MDAFAHAQLTDALARGRLAPAEIAAIPPRELEALFETAARCLDAARDAEASALLGGLVTLFPFSARYWRAYAIALHRRLQVERARAAYEASLALEPDHELTRCYRSEILIYLGHTAEARTELLELQDASDAVAAERAAELLAHLDALSSWEPPAAEPDEPVHPSADQRRFTFDDEHDLPLEPSRFEEPTEPMVVREEVTQTARIFAPISDEPTAPMSIEEITATAVLRRRGQTTPGLHEGSITATAVLPGRSSDAPAAALESGSDTATALLPGRKGRPADPAPHAASPEDTHTDVLGEVPTGTEEPEDEEPTHTDVLADGELDDLEPTLTAVVLRRDGRLTVAEED